MRQINQPGQPTAERMQWVDARGRAFSFTVPAGLSLLEAVCQGFAAHGFAGGVANIARGGLGPFAYVMPALSTSTEHAAFYSKIFRPDGITQLSTATMTLGVRDGAPFFHCHALWTEQGGHNNGGHILPEDTVIAEPFVVDAFGLDGASFVAEPDLETGFKLFGPVSTAPSAATKTTRAFALRLRPNQDFAGSLEEFCRAHGVTAARIRGGVGSIIGAHFEDGRIVEPFATELTLTSGQVATTESDALEAVLEIALVDYTGGLARGRLVRGDNPVLMTMELVIEVLD